ncbi:MAG: cyclin-dependent kinase inhibitor 3 family protein [Gammaproteobacteria bacterium]|nr:cyclin-dependent kinase inhibitor 3 family protein [Gammaproteobacteria bacterium]
MLNARIAGSGAELIDAVSVPGGGMIGMSMCPGMRNGNFFALADPEGLYADLGAFSRWGAAALVTLMEFDELGSYGIGNLPELAVRAGLRHMHLPIPDMDVPDAGFEQAWIDAGAELRDVLRSGGRIVLHCLAGLGRTGTIASRLLVELGMEPESAICAVRAARPGTIQTIAQERYVRRCAASSRQNVEGRMLGDRL